MTTTFDNKDNAFALISHYTKVPIEDIRKVIPKNGKYHLAFCASKPIKIYTIEIPGKKEQNWGLSECDGGYYLWVYTDNGMMLRM